MDGGKLGVACGLLQRGFIKWYQYIVDGSKNLHRLTWSLPRARREKREPEIHFILCELLYTSGGGSAIMCALRTEALLGRYLEV